MNLVFSKHGKDQTERRKIPVKRINETINNPESIKESFRGRKLFRRRFSDKILEVVVRAENTDMVIITAYYLDKD